MARSCLGGGGVVTIYNFFTGKLKIFYEGCFVGQIGRGNPRWIFWNNKWTQVKNPHFFLIR